MIKNGTIHKKHPEKVMSIETPPRAVTPHKLLSQAAPPRVEHFYISFTEKLMIWEKNEFWVFYFQMLHSLTIKNNFFKHQVNFHTS